jgi:hypothetical protein
MCGGFIFNLYGDDDVMNEKEIEEIKELVCEEDNEEVPGYCDCEEHGDSRPAVKIISILCITGITITGLLTGALGIYGIFILVGFIALTAILP